MNQHLKQAIAAARAGKKPQAKVLLARVIKDEPDNVNAWFLLSSLADTEEQKIQHLEKVLELQPNHPVATEQLAELLPPSPEAVEEALPDFDMPELDFEIDSQPEEDLYPLAEVEMPSASTLDDPDEAMAWLERLAAEQGAPLDELPSMSQSDVAEPALAEPQLAQDMGTADTIIEQPEDEYAAAAAAPEDDFSFAALLDSDFPEMAASDSDVPEDPDEAMAWLERLAAEQGASIDELPSLFDSQDSEEEGADLEDDFSWLDSELAVEDNEDYIEAAPTLLQLGDEAETAEEQEAARTLRISNDYDFVSQSKGDSIPAWLAGEQDYLGTDTVITGMPEEEEEAEPEPENLPDWLNEGSIEGWVGDEREKSGQVMWKAGQGDESMKPVPPGSKKARETRRKTAAKQKAAAGSNNLPLYGLVAVAILLILAIFYVLIFQPLG